MNPTIDILLATYNGERFLDEQIQSILQQTYSHWRLIIRDDGSKDGTLTIIRSYAEKYPKKIIVIEEGQAKLGACGNFGGLLQYANADYVMFCDQDDVWLPRKIELTFAKMQSMEKAYGRDKPLLIYTDMKVVDKSLSILSNSFWRNQAFNPNIGKSLNRFLVSNVATGCTILINRSLRKLTVSPPLEAMMHDWWVGLISAAFGRNDYLREPTVLYRQHGANAVGAKWDVSIRTILEKLAHFRELKRINREYLLGTQRQAAAFALRYRPLLKESDYRMIMVYANLDAESFFRKRFLIIQYGFWWAGFVRSVVMFMIV
jgi:glycosyltransferase involved in cell wall biosynthesis